MKTRIVPIGNSQGIRIPKALLEESGLQGEVDISAEDGTLVIRSAKKPRSGWADSFKEMAKQGDDHMLDDLAHLTGWDEEEWEWQ